MNKKLFLLYKILVISVFCTIMFSACSSDSKDTPTSSKDIKQNISAKQGGNSEKASDAKKNKNESQKEGDKKEPTGEFSDELILYSWAEYFPQSIFDKFQEEYGVKVKLITYESEEAFFENYETGKIEYDLSTLWNMSAKYIYKDENLAEIDLNNVPNLKHISDRYKAEFDKEMKYTVPFASGFSCLLVNTDVIKEPIIGYKDLWNPKYKKQISLLQGETMSMALRKLGYETFDSNIEHLKESKEEINKLRPNIAMFNENNPENHVKSGEIGIAQVWSGWSLFESILEENIEIVYPEEGIDIWVDNFIIPKDAKNKREAELFLNFFNRPEISSEFVKFAMCATPNKEARKLFRSEEYAATSLPLELVDKASYLKEVTDERDEFETEIIEEFANWGIDMY